jgi:hypothetical protein
MESKRAVVLEARLQAVTGHQEDYLAEIERLRSESSRLEGALAEALKTQTRYQQAAAKLDALATKTRAMLADSGYRWPDDSAYVRIPKAAVKSLDLLHRPPMPFGSSGELNEAALELFGITAQEKLPTEQALASYWKGVQDLMTATAYETNITGSPSGRLTKTVIVPPLGQPLKTLAEETRAQLTSILGEQREQLLFAGWDEGGIQLFSPGNIWKISDDSQTFTVWVEPTRTVDHGVKHGASRFSKMGGMSAEDSSSQGIVPKPIAERFFNSWLEQFGISN